MQGKDLKSVSPDQRQLLQAWKKAAARLQWNNYIYWLNGSVLGGSLTAGLWLLMARFFPLEGYRWIAIGLLLVCLIAGSAAVYWRRAGLHAGAQAMDRVGMEQSMVTAYEFFEHTDKMSQLQRAQAARQAQALLPMLKSKLPHKTNRRSWILSSIAAGLFLGLLLWPNPMDQLLQLKQQERSWLAEQAEQAGQWQAELEALQSGEEPQLIDMLDKLESYEEELTQSDTALQAVDQMDQLLRDLDESLKEMNKHHKKQEQQWQQLEQAIADAKSQGRSLDRDALSQQLSEEMKAQLQEQLERLEEQTSENKDAASVMKELLATARQQQANSQEMQQAVSGALSGMAEQAVAASEQLAELGLSDLESWDQQQLQETLAAIENTASGLASESSAVAAATNDGQSSGEGEESSGSQSGQSSGTDGEGNGSGQSETGSTQGSGHDNGGSGQASGSGGLNGGTGEGSRELVTTPREYAGESPLEQDGGPVSGSEGEVMQGGSAPAIAGSSRPYEEVFSEYEASARESIDRSVLPESMKHLIRDYFLEIQP